ncbi:hypothetical protein GCM10011504_46580 [Siccirubricoccus deserti]|uniref:Uncharacterized protein n=1 Tax=Siccirubricoccus deserti TaxID=2013562 RepID=A0A9X0UFM4_9PROT|nr:hypothetical protein [Siccirubricoccus deserti]MBC4018131.1 hypothetical protein [Siccirubricoccus deserti]GGC63068.1 hypothetical protein GCM10011504_46580 [Siccirubricoccus deserti]
MLSIAKSETIEGVQVFGDDQDFRQFYLLPNQVSWQILPGGRPNFGFIKYRMPIERANGKKGGGFASFQVELAMTEAQKQKIRAVLEERLRREGRLQPGQGAVLRLDRPTFLSGKVDVVCFDSGGALVEKIRAPSAPSLYGTNAVAIQVEFSDIGARIFEEAIKGIGESFVQANYTLTFQGRMPPGHIRGFWEASSFMTFRQEMHDDTRWFAEDDYEEKITELISKSETSKVEWILRPAAPPGADPAGFEKALIAVEDRVNNQLAEGIKRNILEAIPPENRDVSKLREQGFDNVIRTVNATRISSVTVEYKENRVIEQVVHPPGKLPSLKTVTVDGKPVDWNQVIQTIDADDPFFKSFGINVQVNADFADLPIFGVDVAMEYKGPQGQKHAKTWTFQKPEDIQRFEAFLDGGDGEVTYSYLVNYKGESNVYKSPQLKTKSNLSINVGELGIWKMDVVAGDINFAQVTSAQVMVRYDDGAGVRIEKQFTITDQTREHKIREVIFKTRDKPCRYAVKYFMQDGSEIAVPEKEAEGEQLYINDPFQLRTVSLRTRGDFERTIETIFVDLVYDDQANRFQQRKSMAFSKDGKRFEDWVFPVIDDRGGTLSYTGNILFRTGEAQPIGESDVKGNTLLIGPEVLEVHIEPDLIDWTKVRLATVTLSYEDAGNQIAHNDTFTIRKDTPPSIWSVGIKDKTRRKYTMSAKYFLEGGVRQEVGPLEVSDEVLVLEPPAA